MGIVTSTVREGRPEHPIIRQGGGKGKHKSHRTCCPGRWVSECQGGKTACIALGGTAMAETPEERNRVEAALISALLKLLPSADDEPVSAGGRMQPRRGCDVPKTDEGEYGWSLTWLGTGFGDQRLKSDGAMARWMKRIRTRWIVLTSMS